MGGPCFLVTEDAATGERQIVGPPATDNFQIAPFEFDGKTWHSVEQCYQASKYQALSPLHEGIHGMTPRRDESDKSYGLRVWSAGNRNSLSLIGMPRSDWEAVKLEIMVRICRAKLAANPA